MKNIRGGQQLWNTVRRKKLVIRMISKLGEGAVQELDAKRIKEDINKLEISASEASRFIITPGNHLKRKWNIAVCFVFIIWLFITPIYISRQQEVGDAELATLFIFDIFFLVDRVLDQFVCFYTPQGALENRLYAVVLNNLSMNLVIEAAMAFGPISVRHIHGQWYALIKLFRYGRMFEQDSHI